MKVKLELFGASRDLSDKDFLEFNIEKKISIKDLKKKIINYVDENFKGNENFKKIIETSAFCSEDNNIISENYKITKDQKNWNYSPYWRWLMLHARIIDLKKEKIEVSKAEEFVSSSKFGASLIFKGTVRENNDNKNVTGITYDSHDTMVIKSFEEIYNEVDQKLKIKDKAVYIEHVKGYLGLGEVSIIIAVACPHRAETYILSRYIIEEIKKRSPIWKKEHYENEESEWLKGNPIQAN